MNDDTYEKVRDPLKRYIARCPVCGSDAALWTHKLGGNVTVAVMCSNNQPIGPQEDDGYYEEEALLKGLSVEQLMQMK